MATKKTQKNANKYICEKCDYNTSNKTDYMRHINTIKHKGNALATAHDNKKYICENCEKLYNDRTGLWKHRKTCCKESMEYTVPPDAPGLSLSTNNTTSYSDIPIELILEVIKQSKEVQNVLIEQNKELQKQLLEQNEKMLEQSDKQHKQMLEIAKKPNMINSNNNNKTSFNLQFFLNETCKDAMNIVDFVNSLQLTNNDFETTGKLGFVNGISRIFINNLKKMDVITRPLHCTDVKRETVYIKDNDTWEKDNEEKKKLNWAVNRIAQLNLNQIQQWQQEYPDSVKNNTPDNEKFTELALAALGGRDMEEIQRYNEKIMKNVLKEVILSREP